MNQTPKLSASFPRTNRLPGRGNKPPSSVLLVSDTGRVRCEVSLAPSGGDTLRLMVMNAEAERLGVHSSWLISLACDDEMRRLGKPYRFEVAMEVVANGEPSSAPAT